MANNNDLIPSLNSGVLKISSQPNRFAYLKIPDQVVRELFQKFKERCNDPDIVPPPYFEATEKNPNPVGAHITIVNSGVFSVISTAEVLFDFVDVGIPFECTGIEERVPRHWKEMEKVWVCTIKSRALNRINIMLCRDLAPDESFHFTFAVKPKAEIESIQLFAHTLPAIEKSAKRALSPEPEKEDYLLGLFEDQTPNDITPEHIESAHRKGYSRLVDLLIRICGYRKIEFLSCIMVLNKDRTVCVLDRKLKQLEEEEEFKENPRTSSVKPIPFNLTDSEMEEERTRSMLLEQAVLLDENFSPFLSRSRASFSFSEYTPRRIIDDSVELCLLHESSELQAANFLKDVEADQISSEHIALARNRGFHNVASMLMRKMREKDAYSEAIQIIDGFGYDDITRIIVDAEDEEDAIECLFDENDDPLYAFKWPHINFADDRGYKILAEMIQNVKENELDLAEENIGGFISSDLDDIEIPLRNRKVKHEDIATSIIRNRYDDAWLIKKVQRLSHDKFDVSHAVLARQQGLRLVGKHIRKALI